MSNVEFEYGKKAYEFLGRCVEVALENDDSEVALLCALPLVKLAESEGADYFGYEGGYNYNTAVELGRKAYSFARREGVPSWLKRYLDELGETLEEVE